MATVDLTRRLQIPATLNLESGRIAFGVPVGATVSRRLEELATLGVLHQKHEIPATLLSRNVTYIYRLINDAEVLRSQGLGADEAEAGVKFDVTVVLPYSQFKRDWFWEYPKTVGHYHLALPGSKIASPDFYQVVHGRGVILLQHVADREVVNYALEVCEGDTVLIPPHLAHLTINLDHVPLVFANVCVRRPHLNYDDIVKFGGAGHFFVRRPNNGVHTVINPSYQRGGRTVGPLVKVSAHLGHLEALGIDRSRPLYDYILQADPVLELLSAPREDAEIFENVLAVDGAPHGQY